jgi:hypothetical protein
MGRTRGANEVEEECMYDIGWKARRKETTKDLRCRVVDNIKLDLREIGWCGMDWIDLAQSGDQWRVLVNTVMSLHVP